MIQLYYLFKKLIKKLLIIFWGEIRKWNCDGLDSIWWRPRAENWSSWENLSLSDRSMKTMDYLRCPKLRWANSVESWVKTGHFKNSFRLSIFSIWIDELRCKATSRKKWWKQLQYVKRFKKRNILIPSRRP